MVCNAKRLLFLSARFSLPDFLFDAIASAFISLSCFSRIFLLKCKTLTVKRLLRMRRMLLSVPGLRGLGGFTVSVVVFVLPFAVKLVKPPAAMISISIVVFIILIVWVVLFSDTKNRTKQWPQVIYSITGGFKTLLGIS